MHLPFFYCQVDSLLPPATTCSMCTWLGRVSPCHRRPSSQCQIPPLPETSESVWLLPATSPSHTALILWLFSWHLWQKMSSYKQILFSFALISLLADNIPCFTNARIPLPSSGPRCFILGKALAFAASRPTCARWLWEEETRQPFPGQIPGVPLHRHL